MNTTTIDPQPENDWIMKGMTRHARDRAFEQMLKAPIAVHFGHLESVISLLKYKFLRLAPPADYYDSLASFQRGLRSKLETYEAELKKRNIRYVSTHEVCDLLREEAKPSNVVAFPCQNKAPVALDDPTKNESVFVASLESVYAARVLALVGEKSTAAQALVSLLPKAWQLTSDERVALATNLETSRDDNYASADLDDNSKRALLSQVFQGLAESLGMADARRVLIRWIADVKDTKLAQEARRLLSQACESGLTN